MLKPKSRLAKCEGQSTPGGRNWEEGECLEHRLERERKEVRLERETGPGHSRPR